MFLSVMSPKAWGYAQKELPPTSSEKTFSSNENIYLSRAILTDENGAAICQVNLQENPEFLPQFAEAGSSDLRSLDLPECEEQNLDIVAQYADQAWIKRDVAIVPVGLAVSAFGFGCISGVVVREENNDNIVGSVVSGAIFGVATGGIFGVVSASTMGGAIAAGVGIGAIGALICNGRIANKIIFYIQSLDGDFPEQENE